jgi:hypothetical protein
MGTYSARPGSRYGGLLLQTSSQSDATCAGSNRQTRPFRVTEVSGASWLAGAADATSKVITLFRGRGGTGSHLLRWGFTGGPKNGQSRTAPLLNTAN